MTRAGGRTFAGWYSTGTATAAGRAAGPGGWNAITGPRWNKAAPSGTWGTFKVFAAHAISRKTTGERIEKLPADVRAWRRLIEERMWT